MKKPPQRTGAASSVGERSRDQTGPDLVSRRFHPRGDAACAEFRRQTAAGPVAGGGGAGVRLLRIENPELVI